MPASNAISHIAAEQKL